MENNSKSNYVYFIETHAKGEISNLDFIKKYSEVGKLENAYEIKDNPKFEIIIYRFELLNLNKKKNRDKIEVIIKLEDKEKNKFEKTLTNIKLNQDNFLFDFQFESSRFLFVKKKPPKSLQLSHITQFTYYINYLRNKLNCNKDSLQNYYLILSIQKILEELPEYDLISYLLIFKECSSPEIIYRQLNLFNKHKIIPKKNVDKNIIEELKEMVDSWIKNPDKILSKIKIYDKEDKIKIKFIILILYFNYNYYPERVKTLINDKKMANDIYKGLIKYYNLFKIDLSKEHMKKVIELLVEFYQLNYAFKYNSITDELLQIINENFTKINTLFLNELKVYPEHKKLYTEYPHPYIDFGKFIKQKENDNLKLISSQIKIISQKCINDANINYLYIKFKPSFYETYMDIFYKKNLINLIILQDLIKFMKIYEKSFEIKKDINKYIHDTGMYLGLNGNLNNMEIINYVKNDVYFLPNTNFIKEPNSADIFSKLDINTMDENFKKQWRKIKWETIYGEEYLKFADKIIHLVNHIKDFGLLFQLLNIPELNKKNKIGDLLIELQKHYISLLKTYKKEDCPNFVNDSSELINYTDKLGYNIKPFLSDKLEIYLSEELVYEIYMEFLTKHKNISKNAENQIVHFILNRKNETIKSYLLLYLLERCPNSKEQIILNFSKYELKKVDIFAKEESENIKLIHGLLSNDYYFAEDKLLEEYTEKNQILLDKIIEDIDNYNIIYNEIKHFFDDKKSELAFKKRLLIIYLLDDEMPTEKFKLISERFYEIKNHINELNLLIEDKNFYFKNSNNIDINKINDLIKKIEESNLNFCKNNDEIEKYSSLVNDAKGRTTKRKSIVYKEIYNKEKEKAKYDDNKCLENSNEKFEQFKLFLTCQKIDNLDEEFKEIINSLNLSEEEIYEEVDNLMIIFNLDDSNKKKKITNALISLFYRNKILKLIASIKNIIEITKAKKEYLSNIIDTINSYLEKNEIISTIQFSINLLKIFSINIFDENSKFNQILIKLSKHPEYISFLLNITLEDLEKIREKIKDKKINNNFNEIIQFVKIFENKDEISKMKDKELIKKIHNEINKNYEKNTQTNEEKIEFLWEIDDIIKLQN